MRRKIIENYALNEVLGQGMYGTVYKANHLQSNQEFAVKVIPILKFQENPKLEQCTVNQIKILETIQKNSFIIRYIEMLKTPNNFYFVYEYCDGGTLEHRLKQESKLSEREALKIFRQLLEAFKVLNKYNIMHRDLKPDNIFFHGGCLKLGDFGFCKTLGNANDMASTMLGSPIYMAPEVLKGESYTSKADIWSLGVVFYEMLFGFCPFQSNSIAKLITVLADTELKIPTQIAPVSPATQTLIKKLLVKDQSKRIDWFELLNYNISQDGFISEPQKISTLDELKLISSDRNLDDGGRRPVELSTTISGSSELMFKKKAEAYSKSNAELNKIQKATSNPAPIYDTYNSTSTGSSSPKKQYSQQLRMEQSPYSSPNLLKRNQSPEEPESKRKYLLDQHLLCMNAVKTALNFLKFGEANGLVFALIIFRKIEDKLRKLCDSISYTESQIWDMSNILTGELKQVERQTSEVLREIKNSNIDYSQVDSPRTFLRQKYSNRNQVQPKLWYELITFINETKPNPRATNAEFENTIGVFIN